MASTSSTAPALAGELRSLKEAPADAYTAGNDTISDFSTEVGSDASESENHQATVMAKHIAALDAQETLVIFDWDDTIFPTTWVKRQGDSLVDSEGLRLLAALEQRAYKTLEMALEMGRVVIVTNAERGWVEFSSARFFPSLVSLLNEVDIVSARANYEHHDMACPALWKCLAFAHEMEQTFAGSGSGRRNVISFGDSMHEHEALGYATRGVEGCQAKSIKFLECPEIENLIEEHDLVHASIQGIVEFEGNMDFEISPECFASAQ